MEKLGPKLAIIVIITCIIMLGYFANIQIQNDLRGDTYINGLNRK